MRILYSSNGYWCMSGYGVQSQHLLPRLQALGHTVAQHAWYGLQGGMMGVNDIPIYPMHRDPYGNDVMALHAKNFNADLIITLIDIWVQDPAAIKALGHPWMPYFPVDTCPVSPVIVERAKLADFPVQYSRFGLREMTAAGVACEYVPHGCNVDVYQPSADRTELRRHYKWPADAFVCMMVAANKGFPDRKAFQWQLEAFARFQRRHTEAQLYLHSNIDAPDGLHLLRLLDALEIPHGTVRFVDQYQQIIGLPEAHMAQMYQCADVLLAATMAEGFGIPIIEAQATGVPVVTTDFTAMPELTINGIATEPAQRMWMPHFGSWQAIPSVDAIDAALETIYQRSDAERLREAQRGIAHMRQHYSWDVVVEQYWRPLLERVERELTEQRVQDAGLVLPAPTPLRPGVGAPA